MNLYFRPTELDEAVRILAAERAQILSGGTDFFPALGDRCFDSPIIDISAIHSMRGVVSTDYHRIGGLTTWTDIVNSSLPPSFDALRSAAREIGGIQIQNRGTVAGNLCNASPAADSVPPLLALDAEVELVSSAGTRRVPLSQFIVGNRKTVRRADEILAAIVVPRTMDDAKSVFMKLGARRYLVISVAMVAVTLKTDGSGHIAEARVAVGSCSAVARRITALERELIGIPAREGISTLVRPDHFSSLAPIDDVRATASYRLDAALTLVARALEACARKC